MFSKSDLVKHIFESLVGNQYEFVKDTNEKLDFDLRSLFEAIYKVNGLDLSFCIKQLEKEKNIVRPIFNDIKIDVEILLSKTINFVLKDNETVRDVKLKIEKEALIPIKEHKLYYQGKLLSDNDTLANCNIHTGSKLVLAKNAALYEFKILLNINKGSHSVYRVSSADTILDLKRRINEEDKNMIALNGYFKYDDFILDSKFSFGEYGLIEDSELCFFYIKNTFVKFQNLKLVFIDASPFDTIYQIKEKLFNKEGIEPFRQRIKYMGKILKGSKTLGDYNVIDEDVLYVELFNIKINIKTQNGKQISLGADLNDTIESIKNEISDSENLPFEHQKLIFNQVSLEDQKTLADYNIQNESILFLVLRAKTEIQIYVKTLTNKYLSIHVDPNDSIEKVKQKIQVKQQVSEDQVPLFYEEQQLDNSKQVKDYNIKEESVLKQKIQIFIITEQEKIITLGIEPADKIESVKMKIHDREAFPVEQQKLLYNDQELDDNQTLVDYDVQNYSKLLLVLQKRIKVPVEDLLDPKFDFDFTNIDDRGKIFRRGGEIYNRPCGWKRIALKANGKYEDDKWLGQKGDEGEWPVAYHGTNFEDLKGISFNAFDADAFQSHKNVKAHFTAPLIDIASSFATETVINEQSVSYIMQSRVNPNKIIKSNDEKYWLLLSETDIRPYGICYKLIEKQKEENSKKSCLIS